VAGKSHSTDSESAFYLLHVGAPRIDEEKSSGQETGGVFLAVQDEASSGV
jgi:hypothetical protein